MAMHIRRHAKITNATIYLEDNSLVGVAREIQIPKLEWHEVEHESLGQVAVFKTPSRALQALEGSITWETVDPEIARRSLDPTAAITLQAHWEQDAWGADGWDASESVTMVAIMRCLFKSAELEALKNSEQSGFQQEFTVTRLVQRAHGENTPLIEVDVFANSIKVDGREVFGR
jgi:P2 family phage contractile tail tube protein